MQKFSLISSIILIALITLLFSYLVKAVRNEIREEVGRTERFVFTAAAIAVNTIQDDITFLHRNFSKISNEIDLGTMNDDGEILDRFAIGENYSPYMEDILSEGTLIDFELFDIDNIALLKSYRDNGAFLDFLDYGKPVKMLEMIYIDNLKGFMVFPLFTGQKDAKGKILYYRMDLAPAIREQLPAIAEELLENSYENPRELSKDSLGDFHTGVFSGEQLNAAESAERADLVIDLNRLFNLTRIFDYHFARLDRNHIFFENNANYIDNHLYLMIRHESGNLGRFFKNKINTYLTWLAILYALIVCSVISLVYTTYRIRKSVMREKEFTALVSHELKTPLSVIKLGADNLASGVVDSGKDVIEYGEMIRKESFRLKDMIEKILTISSSLETSEFSSFDHVPLKEIGEELADLTRSLSNSAGVEIRLAFNGDCPTVFCNRKTLTGALFNIVQNSIVYGASFAEEKIVELSFSDCRRRGKEGVLIEIRDFGPGISWKEAQKIFRPFYRGDYVMEQQIAGTGLGLSISRKIIKQHRGQLGLARSLRKETVFEVWIPCRMKHEKNTDD